MRSARWSTYIERERPPSAGAPYEIMVEGVTPPDPADAGAQLAPLAEAGATWWVESDWNDSTVETLRRRLSAGPPAIPIRG